MTEPLAAYSPISIAGQSVSPRLPIYIDSSMMADFRACPTKFYNRYCLGLSSRILNPDLHAGSCASIALRYFREAYFDNGASFDDALLYSFRRYVKAWGSFIPPQKRLFGRMQDHPKDFINMWGAITHYLTTFHPESDTVRPMSRETLGRSPFEFSFAIPLSSTAHPDNGDPFIYCGRTDMLCSFQDEGYILDDKTSAYQIGNDDSHWAKRWRMRGQFIGYTWASQQSGFPVVGAIARGIDVQKTGYKIGEWIGKFSSLQIARWHEELLSSVADMCRFWERRNWPRNYADSCASYGGCSYLIPCDSDLNDEWLSTYKITHWNPLLSDPSDTKHMAEHLRSIEEFIDMPEESTAFAI